MASDERAPNEPLDERLAQTRDSALLDGENVVVQEMGDPGQAIVLTNSRIILLKAGLTATGELNGQKISAYNLSEVTAVNVRKGPMGAVIQICTANQERPAQPTGTPDNVIIFSGAQRVKRCAAVAAQIEIAIEKGSPGVWGSGSPVIPHSAIRIPQSAIEIEAVPQPTIIEQIEEIVEEEEDEEEDLKSVQIQTCRDR